ncbi:MAG TPA: HlyD family secretion protein [Patescibacteria group bacterium]|nr:HlyD family secretion protein [Patescibacteria group bacterium]
MSILERGEAFHRRVRASGRRRRRPLALGLLGVVVLIAAVYGVRLWRYWDRHVSTDDAFVETHVSPVSTRVRGTVLEVLVRDNQEVQAGAPLVRLDPRDLEVKVHQARAALATAQGRLRAAAAGVPMTEGSTRSQVGLAEASAAKAALGIDGAARALDERRSKLRARRAGVQAAQAEVAARQADFERAGLDRGRIHELLERNLIARQEFDHADNAFKTAGAALEAARQRLDVTRAEVAQAEAEVATQEVTLAQAGRQREEAEHSLGDARSRRGEVTVRSAEAASAEAQLAEARATLREAELNLEYTTITAPVSGRVTRRTVEVGQTVQPGQPLLAVVDVASVWVIANYKETQLTHVRPGQRATISVDTHPGLVLRARVESIQSGTGSRFSLLPPENASGNFVKVVQRIPVKLVLEPGQNGHALLVPGMSVVPIIELR